MKEKDSEKLIERKLRERVKKAGGLCLKMNPASMIGSPDRILLLEGGRVFFVELKSTGRKPTKIQAYAHKMLRGLGFDVEVIDSLKGLEAYYEKVGI